MIDQTTAELIHADIDGCLPEARRAVPKPSGA